MLALEKKLSKKDLRQSIASNVQLSFPEVDLRFGWEHQADSIFIKIPEFADELFEVELNREKPDTTFHEMLFLVKVVTKSYDA